MSIDKTLAERGARYGDFTDHALVAQALQDSMRSVRGRPRPDHQIPMTAWEQLSADKRQALTVIADKIARILTGDPEYRDNWHDIQGYAKLAEDRCVDGGQTELALPPVSDGRTYVGDPLPPQSGQISTADLDMCDRRAASWVRSENERKL